MLVKTQTPPFGGVCRSKSEKSNYRLKINDCIFLLNLLELCEPSGTELLDVDRKRYAMNTRDRIPEMRVFVNQ